MGLLARVVGRFGRHAARVRLPRRGAAAPHIELPAVREPPEHVVLRLREVDPTAELAYLGLGVWVLGSVQPNSHRRKVAEQLLANERERPVERQSMGRYRMARLIRAGLRVVDLVDESAIDSMKVVRDFRFADWRYRHCAEEAFEENLKGSDDETDFQRRVNLLLDYNATENRSLWNHLWGGRRHIDQGRLCRN